VPRAGRLRRRGHVRPGRSPGAGRCGVVPGSSSAASPPAPASLACGSHRGGKHVSPASPLLCRFAPAGETMFPPRAPFFVASLPRGKPCFPREPPSLSLRSRGGNHVSPASPLLLDSDAAMKIFVTGGSGFIGGKL